MEALFTTDRKVSRDDCVIGNHGGRSEKEACCDRWSRSCGHGERVQSTLRSRGFTDTSSQSCAATLANHPEKFSVTVLEKMPYCGGQATSISLDGDKYGTTWMNDGVQGGSPAFKHTHNFFRKYGHDWHEVKLQVAFGKGKESFWTNVFPSQLVDQYQKDIRKFGKVLSVIKYTMPVLGLVPIRIMLRTFMFSKDFGDKMVYPLIALFLGTGNQTANVSCAILERLFDDPNMKLWDYDNQTLLPNLPTMRTFPNLQQFYADWEKDLRAKGVDIRLSTDVTEIVSRSRKYGITLKTRKYDPEQNDRAGEFAPQVIRDPQGDWTEPKSHTEHYDELVMCVLADAAKQLLGKTATWREKFVLGGAKFFDDITITHSDASYFSKVFQTHFDKSLAAEPKTKAQEEQIEFAKGTIESNSAGEPAGFRPMYYTHSYNQDPKKIEMAFDVTNYQHQFRTGPDAIANGKPEHDPGIADVPHDRHVFQSIFLDKNNSHLWTMKDIDPSKVIESKWWHQLGHRWQHYVRVVPGMMWINGKNATFFCGSWTLVNMHELACVSGIAAAYRLGAVYEVFDDFAEHFFSNYLLLSHGVRYKKSQSKKTS